MGGERIIGKRAIREREAHWRERLNGERSLVEGILLEKGAYGREACWRGRLIGEKQ